MQPHGSYKVKNVPTGNYQAFTPTAAPAPALKATAKEWTPMGFGGPAPVAKAAPVVDKKPVDPLTDSFKKHGQSDDDIKKAKTIFAELKTSIAANKGVLDLEIFRKIGDLKICETHEHKGEKMAHCANTNLVLRQPTKMLEQTFKKNFAMGTAKPQHHNRVPSKQQNWLTKDTDEKKKLKAMAAQQMKKMKAEKNEIQKIRLILNQITPDNFEKKFS